MSNVNKVILIGRLGADPELKYTTDNTPVATFNLATTDTWKDKSGAKQDRTEWHRIKVWRKLAETAGQYLKKGQLVYVEGRIESREYEGRDGIKRKITEIVASNMTMLSGGSQGSREERKPSDGPRRDMEDDFIPEMPEEDDVRM